jgi:hypothetical protein
MSEHLQLPGIHAEPAKTLISINVSSRRSWIAPCLEPHSSLTTVTQSAVSLLFLQASVQQCFDERGRPVACPS